MMSAITKRRRFWACACVLLLLLTVLCTWHGCAQRTRPAEIRRLSVSPDGRHVAFTVMQRRERGKQAVPAPVHVIDSSGKLLAKTSPGARPMQTDYPKQWFPGGDKLLYERRTKEPSEPYTYAYKREWLVLNVKTGEVTALELGGRRPMYPWLVDDQTVICRLAGASWAGKAGLHLATESDLQWQVRELLPDGEGQWWVNCLWSQQTDAGLQLIVEARGDATANTEDITTFWSILVGPEGILKHEAICRPECIIESTRVSPDGSHLVVGGWSEDNGSQITVYPVGPASGPPVRPDVLRRASGFSFHPDGGELLVWRSGPPDPKARRSARMFLADLKTGQSRKLSIGKTIPSVSDATWLSNESILIGVHGQGMAKLSTKTGEHSYLWRMPGAVE
jgi:hypothetical protein